jgi:hypothetical protein
VPENAQETFARLLKQTVAPALREAGLQGSGRSYLLPDNDWWVQIGFQKSSYSDSTIVKFTVNLKATSKREWDERRRDRSYLKDTPPEGVFKADWDRQRLERSPVPIKPSANTEIGIRLGQVIPGVGRDRWWEVLAGDSDAVMVEVVDAIKRYGIPALHDRMRSGSWTEN